MQSEQRGGVGYGQTLEQCVLQEQAQGGVGSLHAQVAGAVQGPEDDDG